MLYLHISTCKAIPKYISGRTSYFRVWLAFHSYPQLIPQFFNIGGFGPPRSITLVSPWPWVDHSASGLQPATVALFRLGFPAAPPDGLTLPRITTRWLIMQKVRGHPEGLPLFVSTQFQILFHSPLGVLFTFPSRYLFTIGCLVIFSLTRWSSQIQKEFHVFLPTRDTNTDWI